MVKGIELIGFASVIESITQAYQIWLSLGTAIKTVVFFLAFVIIQ